MSEPPVVTIDPAVRWGVPCIGRTPVHVVVGALVGGDSIDTVCEDYGLTRAEVLVACGWQVRHGRWERRWNPLRWARLVRRQVVWQAWLDRWELTMARGDWDAVPAPTGEGE